MKKIILLLGIFSLLALIVVLITRTNTLEPNLLNEQPNPPTSVNQQAVTPLVAVSPQQVTDRFNTFYTDESKLDQFMNVAGISLSDFQNGMNIDIPDGLDRLFNLERWDIYKCADGDHDYTPIVFTANLAVLPNYTGNLYQDQKTFLKNWEPTMVEDLQNILFPEDISEVEYIPQQMVFFDVGDGASFDLRSASFILGINIPATISYMLIGDETIIGNDQSCVEQVQRLVFDLGA